MSEFVSLSAELRRMHNTLARPLENAIQVAAGLEALDGENKRLTEQHRELEHAHGLLQAAHDKKVAALEKEHATLVQERLLQAASQRADLDAAFLARQARAERAREHVVAVEAHLADTRVQHENAMRIMRNELVATQAELDTLRQTLAAEKEEAQKQLKHLRALLDREIA